MLSASTTKCSDAGLNPLAVAVAAENAVAVGKTPSGVCRVTQFQLNCVVPWVRVCIKEAEGFAFTSSVTSVTAGFVEMMLPQRICPVHSEGDGGSGHKMSIGSRA